MSVAAPVKDNNDSRYLSDATAIADCIKSIRDHRATVTLTLDKTGESITCRVLDLQNNGFLIEDILPRTALQSLRKKPKFSMSARAPGSYAYVEEAKITDMGEERGLPYFYIPLPKSMLFQHRRKAARFELPRRVTSAGASIALLDDKTQVGRIIDISVGGCRVAFDADSANQVQIGQVFENCAINLPPHVEIHSECAVRHSHTAKNGDLVCGIELTRMHVTDRRRLEQFIQSLSKLAHS